MDDVLVRLARLDACAVSDALDKLGLSGAVAGIHRMSTDRRISGRVVTVKLDRDDDAGRPAASRHLGTTAIEAARPGDVIVVEQRTGVDAAGWGGKLSLGASLKGIAGVIIDGPARDVDEARTHDFAVFARAAHRTHRARAHRRNRHERARSRSATSPSRRATTSSPTAAPWCSSRRAEIERVLEAAEAIAAREQAMAVSLRAGTPITQVMGKSYETMLKK